MNTTIELIAREGNEYRYYDRWTVITEWWNAEDCLFDCHEGIGDVIKDAVSGYLNEEESNQLVPKEGVFDDQYYSGTMSNALIWTSDDEIDVLAESMMSNIGKEGLRAFARRWRKTANELIRKAELIESHFDQTDNHNCKAA